MPNAPYSKRSVSVEKTKNETHENHNLLVRWIHKL